MLATWMRFGCALLVEAWSSRRDARVRLMMAQIEMLRVRLPGNRVILSPEERARLLRLGEKVGHVSDDLLGIVGVKTYKRWRREQRCGRVPGRVGRPRQITASVRQLIVRLARENAGWGARRIVGELRKLALTPSRSSVRRILVEEGLLPDPDRRAPKGVMTPWRTFVRMHMSTLVACDFFCKSIWTPTGPRVAYALMFIHLGSRRVFVSSSTCHPTGEWMQQQARNVLMWLEDEGLAMTHLIRDRDTKFTGAFDALLRFAGAEIVRAPFQSPIANAFAESWIGSFKRECLNHFWCFGLRHLDHVTQTYVGYYNRHRPHQSLGNVPLKHAGQPPPEPAGSDQVGPVLRQTFLAGLLNHYERRAA